MPLSPTAMLRRKSLKSSTTITNNNNNDSIAFDFDCHKLEDFMFNTMSEYCQDLDLIRSAKRESIGLAERIETQRDVGRNVIEILEAFMNASPFLPAELVYQAHCYIGLLWVKSSSNSNNNNNNNSASASASTSTGTSTGTSKASIAAAQGSFTKALWIAASAIDDSTTTVFLEQVALTMHRLGRLEGARGNYGEAIALLQKAVEKYETVLQRQHNNHKHNNNNKNNNMNQQLVHAYMADARNATRDWNDRLRLQAAAATKLRQTTLSSSSSSRQCPQLRRMSFVREESSESSREFHLKH